MIRTYRCVTELLFAWHVIEHFESTATIDKPIEFCKNILNAEFLGERKKMTGLGPGEAGKEGLDLESDFFPFLARFFTS